MPSVLSKCFKQGIRFFSSGPKPNPLKGQVYRSLTGFDAKNFYSLEALGDNRVQKLPYSIRVLLESAVRNCDDFAIKESDIETILAWEGTSKQQKEIPFKPARVLLQDFTGVPAVADLAGMRDAMARLGGKAQDINPLVPVDLVIDHSVQADFSRDPDALRKNEDLEMHRNRERFSFLKWGAKAFDNTLIVPPGSGIVHQVNLEYLARVVMEEGGVLFPDSVVGTDSHTTMIDGLGVVGWGVGGIEAEAVMLGQAISMVLPEVVGVRLTGTLDNMATATDLVLTITEMLRKEGVVGKFVEFYGPGMFELSLADRATIANMAPEYGATMGFFPVDQTTLKYLRQTGRPEEKVGLVEAYCSSNSLFSSPQTPDPTFSKVLELNLSSIVPSVAGPKRPHDRVTVTNLKKDFEACLTNPVGFKGYDLSPEQQAVSSKFSYKGNQYELRNGSIVIAAITSCTNTSNPSVILGAGMIARNAYDHGLAPLPYIKTTLSPGSKAVSEYLKVSGLDKAFEAIGYFHAGYGCMTCIGNSGDLDAEVAEAITSNDVLACAVLSGNRNFEGRTHPLTRANYLASPMLVVAYSLAGRINIDFETEPLGTSTKTGQPLYLRDIWPAASEIASTEAKCIKPEMFKRVYETITAGTEAWRGLKVEEGAQYKWSDESTYIHNPPFFQSTEKTPTPVQDINLAYCLLNLGDSITTDHISPAGNIAADSPAAVFLQSRGIERADFNTYGSRRGNDLVMARGTFANIRLVNKMTPKGSGPKTVHVPTGEVLPVFDVAMRYQSEGAPSIILAGKEYGSGSSRDWAAKGPYLQGVRCVVAQSYERIHRSNLVGMGILPLQFKEGESADTYKLDGSERFTVEGLSGIVPGQTITVNAEKAGAVTSFDTLCRIDTDVEKTYFEHGGILQFVLRKRLAEATGGSL